MNLLDDLRRRLGIEGSPVQSPSSDPVQASTSSQESNAGIVDSSSALDQFSYRQAQYQQEMERLYKGGDDADGLEAVRLAFRRAGR